MKSLVTGASGFIGGHLTRALVIAGDEVRILVRPTSDTRHLADLSVEICTGDLTDPASLRRAVAGAERVFHCAAIVSDWGDPARFDAVNVEGTRRLLEAALDANVRKFLHVSSTEVYGYPDYPATEQAPYRYRRWPYCETKIEAEKQAWAFAERGLPLTVVRPATVYGPRSATLVEMVQLLQTGQMMLIGGGRKNAGLVYVDNLCDALLLAGEPERGLGRAYNLTDGLDVTWGQFINALAAALGKGPVRRSIPHTPAYAAAWLLESWACLTCPGGQRQGSAAPWARRRRQSERPLLTRMAVEFTGTDQSFPADRARQELGWSPRVGFDQGMQNVRKWLQAEGYLG
jgi:nucleoside-diphosphate-sugar epimerase